MRKFLITSEKFAGTLELLYNEADTLTLFDGRSTNIDAAGIHQLLTEIVPPLVSLLPARISRHASLVCVEADFTIALEDFSREYPYKRNMHLLPAIWGRMSKPEQVLAWTAAQDYRKYCTRNSWYKPKIAAAWLKDKEYLNNWKIL